MSRKIYVSRRLLIFLYAYSHQVALSLHRSNNGTWREVQDFYNSRIVPERVGRYLSTLVSKPDTQLVQPLQDTLCFSIGQRLAYRILYTPFTRQYLLEEEVNYYIQLLKELQTFLAAEEVDPYKVADLGLRFSIFIHGHFQWRMRIKDQELAMEVDHFFANERLITTPLEQFMTGLNF
ncbi:MULTISPECIES: hypothetical protein [unclassified Chitinophaga]|uniref:hypothetical protein n=1 Tax=unclassified Chitinophaga TaxID=2619133 RepID=UPI003010279D